MLTTAVIRNNCGILKSKEINVIAYSPDITIKKAFNIFCYDRATVTFGYNVDMNSPVGVPWR